MLCTTIFFCCWSLLFSQAFVGCCHRSLYCSQLLVTVADNDGRRSLLPVAVADCELLLVAVTGYCIGIGHWFLL